MNEESFVFVVPGDPKGQPRPRAFARNMGGGKFVARVFEAGTAEGWKSAIAVAVAEKGLRERMLEGPLRLSMRCYFARPKSHFRSGKNRFLLKPDAPQFHTAKPDLDNVIKAAKDAMTQIGVWRDDSQICEEVSAKRYVVSTQRSYTEFEISLIGVEVAA